MKKLHQGYITLRFLCESVQVRVLKGNPSTGYTWEAVLASENIVEISKDVKYLVGVGMVGIVFVVMEEIELELANLDFAQQNGEAFNLMLKQKNGNRFLPVVIGVYEAKTTLSRAVRLCWDDCLAELSLRMLTSP